MYLMYADESGDCGTLADGSKTRYFCLTGLVVHELRWRDTMLELLRFRHELKRYLDRMRLSNPFLIRQRDGAHSYKDEPIRVIIEDPVPRDSRESYFIQTADCAVYLLKQHIQPSAYMKKHGGNAYFNRLEPVLCKHATGKHPMGIVMI